MDAWRGEYRGVSGSIGEGWGGVCRMADEWELGGAGRGGVGGARKSGARTSQDREGGRADNG